MLGYRIRTTSEHVLQHQSINVGGTDTWEITAPLREDFERHSKAPSWSLEDFQPANSNVLVRDIDEEFRDADNFEDAFLKKCPTAWGSVWAYPPGYSADGQSAIVVFEGGPNGDHGRNWVCKLNRKVKVWEVQWRHCYP